MSSSKIARTVAACAVGLAAAVTGVVVGAPQAGATGSTPTSFTITVNGANSTSTTASSVSSMAFSGLPEGATGTVAFTSGETALCTATLPATSCTTGILANGSYPGVTGAYSGDDTYAGSTSSNSVNLNVGAGAGTTLLCGKVFGRTTGVATIAKCNVAQKGAHLPAADLLTGGVLTWNKSQSTTTYTGSATSPGQGSCKTGRVEEEFSGSITADTSGYVQVGDAITFDICIASATDVIKLVKGTLATL